MSAAPGARIRSQSLTKPLNYFTRSDWVVFKSGTNSLSVRTTRLKDRLQAGGLRWLDERTYKRLAALLAACHWRSADPTPSDTLSLVTNLKEAFHAPTTSAAPVTLTSFPDDPHDLAPDNFEAMYPDEADPPVTEDLPRCAYMEPKIVLRVSNKHLAAPSAVVPAAAPQLDTATVVTTLLQSLGIGLPQPRQGARGLNITYTRPDLGGGQAPSGGALTVPALLDRSAGAAYPENVGTDSAEAADGSLDGPAAADGTDGTGNAAGAGLALCLPNPAALSVDDLEALAKSNRKRPMRRPAALEPKTAVAAGVKPKKAGAAPVGRPPQSKAATTPKGKAAATPKGTPAEKKTKPKKVKQLSKKEVAYKEAYNKARDTALKMKKNMVQAHKAARAAAEKATKHM